MRKKVTILRNIEKGLVGEKESGRQTKLDQSGENLKVVLVEFSTLS